jgi:hypothetical protein
LLDVNAELLIPRQLIASLTNDQESMELTAVRAAESAVQGQYWLNTRIPAIQASSYYDEITDHGRNGVDPAKAAQEAIHRFKPQLPN